MRPVEDAGFKLLITKLDELDRHIDHLLSSRLRSKGIAQTQGDKGGAGGGEIDGFLARILARLRGKNIG